MAGKRKAPKRVKTTFSKAEIKEQLAALEEAGMSADDLKAAKRLYKKGYSLDSLIRTSDAVPTNASARTNRVAPKRRKERKKAPLVAASMLVVAGLGVGGFYAVPVLTNTTASLPTAVLPSALTATMVDTDATLCKPYVDLGISCLVKWDYSEKTKGTLLDQTPSSGTTSSSVTLSYSKGPEIPTLPILSGITVDEAELALWKAGLTLGEVKEVDASSPKGVILSVESSDGKVLQNGDTVGINVSNGQIKIPNWVGKTKEIVESDAANLDMKIVFVEEVSDGPVGVVLKQSKKGNVSFDTEIRVTVSIAAEATTLLPIPNVVGMTQSEAISVLASEGFMKITTNSATNADPVKTTVKSVSPKVGEEVDPSTEIVLEVS